MRSMELLQVGLVAFGIWRSGPSIQEPFTRFLKQNLNSFSIIHFAILFWRVAHPESISTDLYKWNYDVIEWDPWSIYIVQVLNSSTYVLVTTKRCSTSIGRSSHFMHENVYQVGELMRQYLRGPNHSMSQWVFISQFTELCCDWFVLKTILTTMQMRAIARKVEINTDTNAREWLSDIHYTQLRFDEMPEIWYSIDGTKSSENSKNWIFCNVNRCYIEQCELISRFRESSSAVLQIDLINTLIRITTELDANADHLNAIG